MGSTSAAMRVATGAFRSGARGSGAQLAPPGREFQVLSNLSLPRWGRQTGAGWRTVFNNFQVGPAKATTSTSNYIDGDSPIPGKRAMAEIQYALSLKQPWATL